MKYVQKRKLYILVIQQKPQYKGISHFQRVVSIKRKVVKHGPATYIISLPSKWIKQYNIKKGDELEVSEEGKNIIISTKKGTQIGKINVDISGLDRTSIIYILRSLYKKGYDEITFDFKEPSTRHYRLDKERTVISVIHEETNRLTGMEIIEQHSHQCTIRALSNISDSEFDSILRRVFIMIIEANSDLIKGIENKDTILLQTLEEKHNTITKYISYTQRFLNKNGYSDYKKTASMCQVLLLLDKILDIIKVSGRYFIILKPSPTSNMLSIMRDIHKGILDFYDLFYRFDNKKVQSISIIRDTITKSLSKSHNKMSNEELIILAHQSPVIELITAATEARIAMQY